ncbi:DUF2938 family protein [Marinomonas mediterranea]|uniref:DUF2938 domain-containing protein n=1 Tax=Marinomonas mediterranea TaxID=119864 RepID=UPI00234AEA98|nr:DUF2938 domain-containing protein [Marinomonas mediterranea]WCN12314.1 DUF2938 family protein [Marinomonas mediterranea]
MNDLFTTVFIGLIATIVMDIWGIIRQRLLSIPLNYDFVGRWVAYFPRGKFRHSSISSSPRVRHERIIGWLTHYLTGVLFALFFIGACGTQWLDTPSLMPAMIVGGTTVAFPFLIMQPALGMGIAASQTPYPLFARIQSIVMHLIFGVGLFVGGLILQAFR